MTYSNSFNIALLLILVIANLCNYDMIRDVIWSIVWCDKGGKYNSLKKLKRNIGFFERIRMNYLEQYTNTHRKNYKFWIKLKCCFEVIEFVLSIAFLLCSVFENNVIILTFKLIVLCQSFAIFVILRLQSDFNSL